MNHMQCILFVVVAMTYAVLAKRNNCKEGLFFDRNLRDCVPCSDCQENQLILRVCHGYVDTKCGKFSDFDFQQAANLNVMDDARDQSKNRAHETSQSDRIEKTVKPAQAADDDPWYSITVILVGVLVAAVIAVAVLATIACVMYRKKRDFDPAASSTLIQPIGNIEKMDNFKVVYET